jgi:ATP-binding protein involved in chromosome partitioning
MFRKVGVPILGLVQNMSTFTCPHCHTPTDVFGSDEAVRKISVEDGIDVLGNIPLHPAIGTDGHRGKPTVVAEPASERAQVFMSIAQAVGDKVGLVF